MIETKHGAVLNNLDEMAQSLNYASRRKVLRQAEQLIVAQEQEIDRLKDYPRLTEQEYIWLQIWDIESNGQLATMLNRGGRASWTVCPRCCVDDFTHVEGCGLIPED